MTAKYVVVTGSVGAGATTVAKLVLRHWQGEGLLEGQIEELNPFFKDAQADPHRWTFASQAHFLAASAARHAALREMLESTSAEFVIEDRTPFEHHGAYTRSAFELGFLSEREFVLLTELANEIEKSYLAPDVLVYREMSDEQLVGRVEARGRDGESADRERLSVIYDAFESFAREWDRSPLVRVPATVDVLAPDGEQFILDALSEHLGPPQR